MSAFSNILHREVKGDVQGIVIHALEPDQYSISASLQIWVSYREGKNGIGTSLKLNCNTEYLSKK